MKKLIILLSTCILVNISLAQNFSIIYTGNHNDKTVKAVSVVKIYEADKLDIMLKDINQSGILILVYYRYTDYSQLKPLAIYLDGVRRYYNQDFVNKKDYPTIQDKIDNAYTSGGRIGAICRDGTRSSATGRGACSHHGGVSRWLHSRIKDTDAIVATICKDFILYAGKSKNCDEVMIY